jgi:CRISPR-associated protein Csh1
MISDMRKMAEAFLASPRIEDAGQSLTPEQRRLEFLCESHEPGTPVYVLYPGEGGISRLRRQEMQADQSWRAPWIKPGGPNSPYLIPVFKVERKTGGSESKRVRTLAHFDAMSRADTPAGTYFRTVLGVLKSNRLARQGGDLTGRDVPDAYGAVIDEIVTRDARLNKDTPVFLVATDTDGEMWPGDDARLVDWLLTSEERRTIYGNGETPSHPAASCALCQGPGPIYPNALPGAGLNFVNGAFRGSFPGMSEANSWQRFAICATCADYLYIYKSHIAPGFTEPVVGSKALIIPAATVGGDTKEFGQFIKEVKRMLMQASRAEGERTVLRRLSGAVPVATLSLLWAENFGQKIDGIRGFVTHILPTRLAELDKINSSFNRARSPFYPRDLRPGIRREIDLNLRLAEELLRRPGGKEVKSENQSPRRRVLLYQLAECVFHTERQIEPGLLWQEINETAQAYWRELISQENGGVLYRCNQEAPKEHQTGKWLPLTLNAWIRHLFLLRAYLSDERVNVLPKENFVYEPTQDSLKPLLAEARGLDTDGKKFAFLLGILYGHLIYVQARKAEVNVASNALSWMKGGRLRAAELHELYGKIAAKLLEYDALEVGRYRKFKEIYELETEIGHIGKRVPIPIQADELPDEQVLYFLMLGMALSYDFTTSGMSKTKGDLS